jgi:hypothetical protein
MKKIVIDISAGLLEFCLAAAAEIKKHRQHQKVNLNIKLKISLPSTTQLIFI